MPFPGKSQADFIRKIDARIIKKPIFAASLIRYSPSSFPSSRPTGADFLEAPPADGCHLLEGETFQVDLCGLDRFVPQELADHLDGDILFLEYGGEGMSYRVGGDGGGDAGRPGERLQVPVEAGERGVVFPIGRLSALCPAQEREEVG